MAHSRTSFGARRFAVVLAAAVTLGAVGVGGYNMAAAQSASEGRPVFIPIRPCRLIDTRVGPANTGPFARPIGSETVTITAHGSNGQCIGASAIPSTAVGLSMNVTAIRATQAGTFITFWGSGPNPGVSNLNPVPGQPPTPNAVNTPLSDTGTFNLANALGTVEILIDVNGYYADHNHDDRYFTETESDDRYYTETESDARYRTQAELDAQFAQLSDLPFVAGGAVLDDETIFASVQRFRGPAGVTASVTETGVGAYLLTISNTGGLTSPIIQITGVADGAPGSNTGATACALSSVPPATAGNDFAFGVGCFGEDDAMAQAGAIVAEDISFTFVVIG